MKKILYFPSVLLLLFAGCASEKSPAQKNQTPSPQEVEWANKVIALDKQEKALQKREQELNREEQQLEQAKQRVEKEKKQTDAKAWVAENKVALENELTECYRTNSKPLLESFGLDGEVLDYLVDDVSLDGNVFSFSQLFLWKNSDGTGEIARINTGYDIQSEKFIGSNIVGTKHFSVEELASITNGNSEQNQQMVSSAPPKTTSSKTPTVWALNSQTINAAYTAGIGLAVFGIEKWIEHALQSDSQ